VQAKLLVAGKRSGKALVVGRQDLLQALSASSALAVAFDGVWVGRAGFVQYLRLARQGASVIKLVPEDGRLKVVFGALGQGVINSGRWVPEKRRVEAQFGALQVQVSPRARYVPNVGAGDLADALTRALASTLFSEDALGNIAFLADGETLTIRATDGTVLFETVVPVAGVEGQAVVWRKEAQEIARALKRASRARVEIRRTEGTTNIGGQTVQTESARVACLAGPYEFLTTELVPRGPHLRHDTVGAILNTEAKATAFVGPKEFAELLRGVWMLAGGEGKERQWAPISLILHPGRLVLESRGTQDASVGLEAHGRGRAEHHLNATVLLRALKAFSGASPIEFALPGTQDKPIVISSDDTRVAVLGLRGEPAAQPAEEAPSTEEEEQEVAAQVAEDVAAIGEAEVEAEEAELAEAAEEMEEEEAELAPVS